VARDGGSVTARSSPSAAVGVAGTRDTAQVGAVSAQPAPATLRRRTWLDRLGYYAPTRPGIPASTRQAEIIRALRRPRIPEAELLNQVKELLNSTSISRC